MCMGETHEPFETFSTTSQREHQFAILLRSSCSNRCWFRDNMHWYRIPSANSWIYDDMLLGKSLIKFKNKRAPRTYSWGMPEITSLLSELWSSMTAYCDQLERKHSIHDSTNLSRWRQESLLISRQCGTRSSALEMFGSKNQDLDEYDRYIQKAEFHKTGLAKSHVDRKNWDYRGEKLCWRVCWSICVRNGCLDYAQVQHG